MKQIKTWWEQRQCPHWQEATRMWDDGHGIIRETVCLSCGKSLPNPPLDGRVMERLLDDLLAKSKQEKPLE